MRHYLKNKVQFDCFSKLHLWAREGIPYGAERRTLSQGRPEARAGERHRPGIGWAGQRHGPGRGMEMRGPSKGLIPCCAGGAGGGAGGAGDGGNDGWWYSCDVDGDGVVVGDVASGDGCRAVSASAATTTKKKNNNDFFAAVTVSRCRWW